MDEITVPLFSRDNHTRAVAALNQKKTNTRTNNIIALKQKIKQPLEKTTHPMSNKSRKFHVFPTFSKYTSVPSWTSTSNCKTLKIFLFLTIKNRVLPCIQTPIQNPNLFLFFPKKIWASDEFEFEIKFKTRKLSVSS